MDPSVGHVVGVPLGSTFPNRQALRDARIHRPLQAGIDGNRNGAYSIVVSGGYVDDEDLGNEIVYTGHGGNDSKTKRQIADQKWERGNAALRVSQELGLPVRVTRGHKGDAAYAPKAGYRYDGVFLVERSWDEIGVDGFKICRFHLVEANQLVSAADRQASRPAMSQEPGGAVGGDPQSHEPVVVQDRAGQGASSPVIRLTRPSSEQNWVLALVTSPLFEAKRHAVGSRLSADRARAVLSWLDANAGELPHGTLAAAIEIPAGRLAGLVATLSRCLNIDGYPVLNDDGARILLDSQLAKTQFGVA